MPTPPQGLDLDTLDVERPTEPFRVKADGRVITLRHAADVPWSYLAVALNSWIGFLAVLVPAEHIDVVGHLAYFKMEQLFRSYTLHFGLCESMADNQRLASLLANYGKAIERDLAPGIDLATEWQSRRWRRLLNLIDGLPRNSAYNEAIAEDDVLADRLLEETDVDAVTVRRRVTEFSPEVELLTALVETCREMVQAIGATRGAKPRRLPPLPRPVTAIDRARRRHREVKHRSVVSRMLPHKAKTPA